jgi:multiple sugar transport system permease protein
VLLIAAGCGVLWTVFPFIWFFLVSLTTPGHIPRRLEIPDLLTLKSYAAVLFGGDYASVGAKYSILPNLLNSLIVATMTVVMCLTISTGAAYTFSRFHWRGFQLLFNSLLVVRMTPSISLAVPVFLMMSDYRLIDTHIGLAAVYTVVQLPLAIWLMKGFFDTIPRELEEQAFVDGATPMVAVRRIIVPLAAPGVAVTACFLFLAGYIEYMFALVLSRGTVNTLPMAVAGYKAEHQVFYNEMAAASFVSMIPLAVFFYFTGRYMVGGLSMGALK